MKILKKIGVREVKRTFVISDLMGRPIGKHRYFKIHSQKEFEKRLAHVRQQVLKMSVAQLKRRISVDWPKRIQSYEASEWYLADMTTTELGTWKRGGGLPLAWTNRSLKYTADKVRRALKSKSLNSRAKRAIPGILKTDTSMFQNEKYLLPIVFRGGFGTNGRKGLKYKTKGDIDDGNMRSTALAVGGAKILRVYFGIPKKNKKLY
ncbi:MAG: hypothetical protein ACYC6X_03525 [Minisyncoccota bacterium]